MTLLSLKLYSQTTHHNKVPHDWFVDLSILSLFENGVCPSKMGGLHGQAPIGAAIAKQKKVWFFVVLFCFVCLRVEKHLFGDVFQRGALSKYPCFLQFFTFSSQNFFPKTLVFAVF